MAADLTGFRITELHGRQNVNIVIEDDCVVLVGVNGLGKTTIINILYYFLTRQWLRLLEYQFKSVAVDIAGQTLSISRSQLESPINESEWRRRFAHVNPRFHLLFDRDPQLLYSLVSAPHDLTFLRQLAERSHLPLNMLMMMRRSLEEEPLQQTLFESLSEVKELESQLARLLQSQVLYLPTYRRIERDLEKIFPGLEEEIQKYRSRRSAHDDLYIEFVEFGMRDVERRFDELFTQLKERARFELNSLAATYLGEVIRGEADTYDTSLISSLDETTIAKILNRVEEREILDEPDKETLRHVINKLKTADKLTLAPRDKYIGHFFSKLATIHRSLAEAEAAIEGFVQVCNRYLEGKRIVFDDRNYTISIEQDLGNTKLEMRHLSSGEKQIVSLFTHVYIGDGPGLIILIDEPELSLSVPWQKQLLPDIRRSDRCRFLAAVTHSPFIFDNDINRSATDLRQCIVDK